jgi:hypothetical protein
MGKAQKKLIVPTSHPRNPFVVAAKLRQAGRHAPSRKTERQHTKNELRKIPTIHHDGDFYWVV